MDYSVVGIFWFYSLLCLLVNTLCPKLHKVLSVIQERVTEVSLCARKLITKCSTFSCTVLEKSKFWLLFPAFFFLHTYSTYLFLHTYSCILEKELAAHSRVLAWRAPWTEEPGGCSPWGHKESDTLEQLGSSIHVYSGPFGVEASFTWVVVKVWRGAHDLEFFDGAWESFILFMGFSRQAYWSGLPFFSPVDHILSDLSTMTRPSWVAPHGMA